MVIDTGQIKAEMRREDKERKKKIQECFGIVIEMLKLHFLTFRPATFAWDAFITNMSGHCTKNQSSEQLEYM